MDDHGGSETEFIQDDRRICDRTDLGSKKKYKWLTLLDGIRIPSKNIEQGDQRKHFFSFDGGSPKSTSHSEIELNGYFSSPTFRLETRRLNS